MSVVIVFEVKPDKVQHSFCKFHEMMMLLALLISLHTWLTITQLVNYVEKNRFPANFMYQQL